MASFSGHGVVYAVQPAVNMICLVKQSDISVYNSRM